MIYFDNSATTFVSDSVRAKLQELRDALSDPGQLGFIHRIDNVLFMHGGLYNIFVCCPVAGCLIGLCGASRHVDVSEFVAIFEYIVAQRGRGGRLHDDRGQAVAGLEGLLANARHLHWNAELIAARNALQAAASVESLR